MSERMVAIAWPPGEGEGLALEGIHLAPQGGREPGAPLAGAVVAPPHPLYGGSMDNPVVSELASAAARAGLASLRFNWRGVGASPGRASGDAEDARVDYAAALAHLADTVDGSLVACGYSFGACAAVAAASPVAPPADAAPPATGAAPVLPRIRRLLLVAPPPLLLDAARLRAFRGEVLILAAERDTIAPAAALEAIAAALPRGRCETIPRADHFFGEGLREIGRLAADFMRRAAG